MSDHGSRPTPYDTLPELPKLEVRSDDVVDGARLAAPQAVSYTHLTLPTILRV